MAPTFNTVIQVDVDLEQRLRDALRRDLTSSGHSPLPSPTPSPSSSPPCSRPSSPIPQTTDASVVAYPPPLDTALPDREAAQSAPPKPRRALSHKEMKDRDYKRRSQGNYRARKIEEDQAANRYNTQRMSVHAPDHVANVRFRPAKFDMKAANVCSTGFIGHNKHHQSFHFGKSPWLSDVLKAGMQLVKWDGTRMTCLVDKKGRIIVTLRSPPPNDPTWPDVRAGAAHAMKTAYEACSFNSKSRKHTRGAFPTLRRGPGMGGGQTRPTDSYNAAVNKAALDQLVSDKNMVRMAGWDSSSFAQFFPKAFERAEATMRTVHDEQPKLSRNFYNSVYPMASFNFVDAVCDPHLDVHDDPCVPCVVRADGTYDYKRGGHFLLLDLGLVIEFPPGTSILVSSAAFEHGNCRIAEGEERSSWTQYMHGGMTRYVEYGCRLEGDLSPLELQRMKEKNRARPVENLELFSTKASLVSDLKRVFSL